MLRSELKLPEAVYHLLSTYLLPAIELKGSVQLTKASAGEVALHISELRRSGAFVATAALGITFPFNLALGIPSTGGG